MHDVDAGSMLLPVIEEDSPTSKSPTDLTQYKPDVHDGESTATSPSDRQRRELPHEESRPMTNVPPANSEPVQEDLQQLRECGTQSQPAASNEEPHFLYIDD